MIDNHCNEHDVDMILCLLLGPFHLQASESVIVSLNPTAVRKYTGSLHIFLFEIDEVYTVITLSGEAVVAKVQEY